MTSMYSASAFISAEPTGFDPRLDSASTRAPSKTADTWSYTRAVAAFVTSKRAMLNSLSGLLSPRVVRSLTMQLSQQFSEDDAGGDLLIEPDSDSFDLMLLALVRMRKGLRAPSLAWSREGYAIAVWQPDPKKRLTLRFISNGRVVLTIHDGGAATPRPDAVTLSTTLDALPGWLAKFEQRTWANAPSTT